MKRISTFSLALTYVGIFLGAGFVSGQELWQFFACFGLWGFGGFLELLPNRNAVILNLNGKNGFSDRFWE